RYSPAQGAQYGPGALRIESSDPNRPELDLPLSATLNRAPLPLARAQLGTDAPRPGPVDAPVGATVGLDATGSSDPDGDLPLAFRWTLASRPVGSAAAVGDSAAAATPIR